MKPLSTQEPSMAQLLRAADPPEWIQRMWRDYATTGTYRAEDLRRLLGDQRRGVRIGPNGCAASFLKHETTLLSPPKD